MCYACSAADEGGPVGARDWLEWFRFWFRPGSWKHIDTQETHIETVGCQCGLDEDATAGVVSARVTPVDLSTGL